MSINWVDLGEVWSGRDLDEGEKVTISVFDKELQTLLEQLTFVPSRGHTGQFIWLMDFCRFINTRSALVRAGARSGTGWEILESGYKNKYWTCTSRKLQVVTNVPRANNWSSEQRTALHASAAIAAGSTVRVDVRSTRGECLETLTLTPEPKRLAAGQWPKDIAGQINKSSKFVRAGILNGQRLQPWDGEKQNFIWVPKDSGLTVSWSLDALKEAGRIQADSDARDAQRISLFVFDDKADKLLDRITLTARAASKRLQKEQWPADLARQINASSGHVKAGERSGNSVTPKDSVNANLICQRHAGLRTFTTALHLDNWEQATSIAATADLTAAECIVVTVASKGKGHFCEERTFIPASTRLKAAQWAHDLAVHLNKHSLYLKAGVKDSASRSIVPKEDAKANLIWLPAGCGLKVSVDKSELKKLGSISLQRDMTTTESCRVYVLDDTSEEVLREFTFTPTDKRNTKGYAAADLAARINGQTQLIVVGEKKTGEPPRPVASSYLNTLWACAKNVRAFTTLHSLGNWEKGALIGERALQPDEQVVILVKGSKSGRIFESLLFKPTSTRCSEGLWTKDCCFQLSRQSRLIKGGRENQTLLQMEPWHADKVNHFWTPKGSGLLVETFIISGFPCELSGMTGEARQQFEQYAEARRHITIDVRTGQAALQIPLAELFADDSFNHPFKVSLAFDATLGLYLQIGGGNQPHAPQRMSADGKLILRLSDGRQMLVDQDMQATNAGDLIVEKKIKAPAQTGANPLQEYVNGFSVTHRTGVREEFKLLGSTTDNTDPGNPKFTPIIYQSLYASPSGQELKFSYYPYPGPLKAITRGDETLLEVKLSELDALKGGGSDCNYSIVLFPKSKDEKRTFTFSAKAARSLEYKFEADGFASAGKTCYTVSHDSSGRLTGIVIERQHAFTVNKTSETDSARYSETLEYASDGKVRRHLIAHGGGMDELVHDYFYSADATSVTGHFLKARSAFTRLHNFSTGQSFQETYGSQAVPISRRNSHVIDLAKRCILSSTQVREGDVLVEEQALTVDATGNPVSRNDNGQVTHWTYYNNYQQYRVTETRTRVDDWSFFGIVFKLAEYLNPVGVGFAIGGRNGLTWGTRIGTTVEMLPANNNYAKSAFNLPVAIVHCGDERPLYGDVESELVCRLVDGKEQAQRLTFFGYAKFAERVRPQHKLTILQPDCTRVDVSTEQLTVATEAARPLLTSLEAQVAATSGKEQEANRQALADLKASLAAQSKVNAEGFKLNSRKNSLMSLETFDYHTDPKLPGYGTVKSIEVALLSSDGKKIDGSVRTTSFSYALDTADASKVIVKTTVTQGKTSLVSTQKRSRHTGRLYESLDTEGIRTVHAYDPQGNLRSQTVSKDGTQQSQTTCKPIRNLHLQYDLVDDDVTTRLELDALGRRYRQWHKSSATASFVQTHEWTYDSCGRCIKSRELDYGEDNKRVAIRQTSTTWDETSGQRTLSHLLTDAANKETRITQVLTPGPKGERFVQGKFSLDRQYNAAKGLLTEHYANSGSDGCKIEREVSADGLLKSIRYLKVDKAGLATEQDKVSYAYDGFSQVSKVTPSLGAASTYTYDAAGRLQTTTRNGVVLGNRYADNCALAVAREGYVSSGGKEQKLGSQTADMLGRLASQTIDGAATEFSYAGASTSADYKDPAAAPTPLADCSSSIDKATRTHTQSVGKDKPRTSVLVFSTSGRVLKFTDLTGAVTTYEYDFFNRLLRSSNEHCLATWTYADSGLLTSESVTALKGSKLTMHVAYVYDALGQEIKRTFTCDGVDTLTIERTLLADGRLSSSCVTRTKTQGGATSKPEKLQDSYEYDEALRLKKWQSPFFEQDYRYDALGNLSVHPKNFDGQYQELRYLPERPGQLFNAIFVHSGTGIPIPPFLPNATHDSAGRLLQFRDRRLAYHGNGQVAGYSADSGASQYVFSYDGEGRVRGGTQGKKSDTYHYRGERVYALEQSDTDKSEGFGRRTLVLRNESRSCLMQDIVTDARESRSFELRDANGTVFASVNLADKRITRLMYCPYGNRYQGGSSERWLGFKGEPLNRLGLYHLGNGYRLYDPELGQFLSPDSWSPFGAGGAARYVYSHGDPVNLHDPSGHQVIGQYERWGNRPAMYSTVFRVVVGAVSMALAPFTSGTSLLMVTAMTTLNAVSFILDMVSMAVAESDPQLSRTLETWGQVFGMTAAAAGIASLANGYRGVPRKMLITRGGSFRRVIKWPMVPSRLQQGQQIRSQALSRLIEGAREAKEAGNYGTFMSSYFHPEPMAAMGALSGAAVMSPARRLAQSGKNLFKGAIRHFDDSALDFLGRITDVNNGPAFVVQRVIGVDEHTLPIVAGPTIGRDVPFL